MIVPTKLGLDYKKVVPPFSLTQIAKWLETIMTPLELSASWEAMLSDMQNTMTQLDPELFYWFIPNFIIKGSDVDITQRLSVFEHVVIDPVTQGIYVPNGSAAHSFCILMEIPMQKGWIETVEEKRNMQISLISGYKIVFDYGHVKSK